MDMSKDQSQQQQPPSYSQPRRLTRVLNRLTKLTQIQTRKPSSWDAPPSYDAALMFSPRDECHILLPPPPPTPSTPSPLTPKLSWYDILQDDIFGPSSPNQANSSPKLKSACEKPASKTHKEMTKDDFATFFHNLERERLLRENKRIDDGFRAMGI